MASKRMKNPFSKEVPVHQSKRLTERNTAIDGLYARIRQLEAKVTDLESVVSTLKRDVARVDRNYYNHKDEIQSQTIPQKDSYWDSFYKG